MENSFDKMNKMIQVLFFLFPLICHALSKSLTKPTITLDEFFDYTSFPSISLSPNGQYLIVHTQKASWDSSSYNNSLWLYELSTERKTLITDKLSVSMKPKWSPSGNWIAFLLNEKRKTNNVSSNTKLEMTQII